MRSAYVPLAPIPGITRLGGGGVTSAGRRAGMVVIWKRSGERTSVRFKPGCLIWSIVLSIVLTVLVNVLIRLF